MEEVLVSKVDLLCEVGREYGEEGCASKWIVCGSVRCRLRDGLLAPGFSSDRAR